MDHVFIRKEYPYNYNEKNIRFTFLIVKLIPFGLIPAHLTLDELRQMATSNNRNTLISKISRYVAIIIAE